MLSKVIKCTLIVITVIIMTFSLTFSQEEGSKLLKEYTGEAINKGVVIAFGNHLKPPYTIKLEKGRILINDIVYYPREQEINNERMHTKVSEVIVIQHNLIMEITQKYIDYYNKLGEIAAKQKILNEYKNNPSLKGLELNKNYLIVNFIDGNSEWIDLNWCVKAKEEIYDNKKKEESYKLAEVKRIKKFLSQNGVLIFGHGYTISTDIDTFAKAEKIIKMIKRGILTQGKANSEITDILGPQGAKFLIDLNKNTSGL